MEGGSSNFDALLGGRRSKYGEFDVLGKYGYYWSATDNIGYPWNYYFLGDFGKINRNYSHKELGYSCRCLKD